MIDKHFVLLAVALSMIGAYGYVRDTLAGRTAPNRVTWGLWAIEGLLGFVVEIQQHVGMASLMTLTLGFVPCVVVVASFRNPRSVWRIGKFDVFCGVVSLAGLVFWSFINQPTVALVFFVAADQVAALPTLRKSWIAPASETPRTFLLGTANCGITLLTLKHLTTGGALFPGCVGVADLVIGTFALTRIGPRVRRSPLTPKEVAA